jgi:LmbE family N-acetylglucosaminyl deacetylase
VRSTRYLLAELVSVAALGLAVVTAFAPQPACAVPELPIHEHERLLVVAPHPDDESLGAAGLIQRVLAKKGTVTVVTMTAGDGYREALQHESGELHPRPVAFMQYGERRIAELEQAVKVLGRGQIDLAVLGFPDGGLDGVLRSHWDRTHPERSVTTGESSPPYPEAENPRLKYDGADLRRELLRIVRETKPTIVALADPDDRHPDHATTGIFTLLALDDWAKEAHDPKRALPRLLAYLVHWPNWPKEPPQGLTPAEAHALPLELPDGLPPPPLPEVELTLTDKEVATKMAALQQHHTQQEAMGSFLARFERRTEPFRVLGEPDLDEVEELMAKLRARSATHQENAPE